MDIKAGSTSVTKNVLIYNSSTGLPMTGLAYDTAGLTAYYVLPGAASVSITLATQTATGAYSSGGFVEIDATNMPGVYRLDIPNAALASGRGSIIYLQGVTDMLPCVFEINIIGYDNTLSYMPSNVQQINSSSNAATNLRYGAVSAVTGTAITGTLSTTQASTNLTGPNDDQYKGRTLIFTSGTNINVAVSVTAYNSGTSVVTYQTLPTGVAPSNGDTFVIV